ncbi:MAG: hypothetical protein KKA22_06270 [Gammaproteobacteria bacterium]|nr:hypothetical protein [Gammaproteobacteria bacterium]MBU1407738.1 hypothetical protein [Gammaproteobacteria bacterium]MBU1531851.1 hypothetical protein [Gammaproteobacteria bacterium]
MPIEFVSSPDGIRVRQSFVSPTVYLDHWALRLFSDDSELQDRLVRLLLQKQGTLLLSHISFAEFAKPTDRQHCISAEKFLERLLPNIYLTDFAYDKLQIKEESEQDNRRRFWPPADLPQLKLFAERAQDSPLGFTMHGFISMAHDHHPQLEPVTLETVHVIRDGIEACREDPIYVHKSRNVLPDDKRTRTYVIMGELMREFVLDPSLAITDNDVIDMLHAAMPINCCDFVLLDGAWASRVAKMKQRIENAGSDFPIAKCYSKRGDGVSQFLRDLESFDSVACSK